MSGSPPGTPLDSFQYRPEDVAEFQDRFRIEPVAPAGIAEHIEDEEVLATTDIPDYLERGLANRTDTGLALYRLIQLFGTPNVPGLEAGADQPTRNAVTWQYLFRVRDEPEDATPAEYLVSVYDNRTDLSVGLSAWLDRDAVEAIAGVSAAGGRTALEPVDEPVPTLTMPEDDTLTAVVQLVLSIVNHAVKATYKDLHV